MPRSGDPEGLHAAGEGHPIAGLDDQVDVSALDAEVDDVKCAAELGSRGARAGLCNGALVVRESCKRCFLDRAEDCARARPGWRVV
jgi:hypothetical protein